MPTTKIRDGLDEGRTSYGEANARLDSEFREQIAQSGVTMKEATAALERLAQAAKWMAVQTPYGTTADSFQHLRNETKAFRQVAFSAFARSWFGRFIVSWTT